MPGSTRSGTGRPGSARCGTRWTRLPGRPGASPAAIERTVAVLVRLPGGRGRVQGETAHDAEPPVEGSAEEIAATLRAFAAEGIAHVQLVVDPITLASIEALAPVLEDLDRG